MIRSVLEYGASFATCLADARKRALLKAHLSKPTEDPGSDQEDALRSAIGYLLRAQQQGDDGGVGSYHLVKGWGASYPETTGYAIPTLMAAGQQLDWQAPMDAASRAADWLLTIQCENGGWPGGRVGEGRPAIVFNTAQVIRGLMAMYGTTGEQRYLSAAERAGRWIVSVQDADGAWRASNFLGVARVYDTYVSAPLLHLDAITGNAAFKDAALRNLEWVLTRQQPNGWFADADNTIKHNDRPITHTIAYTLDGLIECHRYTDDVRYLNAATTPAVRLADLYLRNGSLAGRYNTDWQGSESSITTGCAQMAIVWSRLFSLTSEERYATARDTMVSWLIAVQRTLALGPKDGHGAVTGSVPLWGRYEKFACPNWATKYVADALLCAQGKLPSF